MHVKYASRHAVYPVPNVCDAVAVIDAARARLMPIVSRVGVFEIAPVRCIGCDAVRAVVVVPVRAVDVPVRAVRLLLPIVAVRDVVAVSRVVTGFVD